MAENTGQQPTGQAPQQVPPGQQQQQQAPSQQQQQAPSQQQQQPPAQQTPAPLNVPPTLTAPPPAPEEIVVTFPEGAVVDPEVAKEFKQIVGDKNLTASQRAQKLVDLQWRQSNDLLRRQQEDYNRRVADWRKGNEEALKRDPDFGKDFEANKAIAQRPLAEYGDPELARELAVMGLENHPRLTKFLHKIGQAMGESKTPTKQPAALGQNDETEALYRRYPSMRPKTS